MSYTVLGISSGNGVMLYPFKQNLLGNIEIRRDYLINREPIQWRWNFGDIPYSTEKWIDGKPDVILGHPKCGNSSIFALSRGKKFTTSKDEPSLTKFFEGVKHYSPKIWVMENLPKLLETYTVDDIESELDDEYKILTIKGPVTWFGNSQESRVRLLLIGFKKSIFSFRDMYLFQKKVLIKDFKPKTHSELTQNMTINGRDTESLREVISVYGGFRMSLGELKEYWKRNTQSRHFPIVGGKMKTAPGVYINRANSIPLTVRKTNRQFNPDGVQMSPRELARIQGIPDDFKIVDDIYIAPLKTLINKGRFTVANTPPYEVGARIKLYLDFILS